MSKYDRCELADDECFGTVVGGVCFRHQGEGDQPVDWRADAQDRHAFRTSSEWGVS